MLVGKVKVVTLCLLWECLKEGEDCIGKDKCVSLKDSRPRTYGGRGKGLPNASVTLSKCRVN